MSDRYNVMSFNGEYIPSSTFSLELNNRAFRYGDGLFESMHANGLEVQFLADHYARLMKGAKVLKIELPNNFTIEYLAHHINGLLNRCKLYQGAKVRIYIFRKSGGLYFPENNEANIILECDYLSKGPYELNKEGVVLGVYNEYPRLKQPFSEFKSMNALPFVMAGIYAKENKYDDVLLVDSRNYIVEATSSNVFCVKDKTILTPSLNSGCVQGVMRKNVIKTASTLGYELNEVDILSEQNLLEMDEMFLTNAIAGIKWVAGIGNRRYYKRYSVKILKEMNRQHINSYQG